MLNTYKSKEVTLYNYIRRNDLKGVEDILYYNDRLDVVSEKKYFNMAISNQNVQIVEVLINYFNNVQLVKHKHNQIECLLLKKQLHDVLEYAVEDVEISEEMKKLLSPYLEFGDDNDCEYEKDVDEVLSDIEHEETTGNNTAEVIKNLIGSYIDLSNPTNMFNLDMILRNTQNEKVAAAEWIKNLESPVINEEHIDYISTMPLTENNLKCLEQQDSAGHLDHHNSYTENHMAGLLLG
jgi:hypothetical protein